MFKQPWNPRKLPYPVNGQKQHADSSLYMKCDAVLTNQSTLPGSVYPHHDS